MSKPPMLMEPSDEPIMSAAAALWLVAIALFVVVVLAHYTAT